MNQSLYQFSWEWEFGVRYAYEGSNLVIEYSERYHKTMQNYIANYDA